MEAAEVFSIELSGQPTEFYLLKFYDMFVSPQKDKTFYTIIRKNDDGFTKVSIKDCEYLPLELTLLPASIDELFADVKRIDAEEPIDAIQGLFDISIPNEDYEFGDDDSVNIYFDCKGRLYDHIILSDDKTVATGLLTSTSTEVIEHYLNERTVFFWKIDEERRVVQPSPEEVDRILAPFRGSIIEEPQKPIAVLYIGPHGDLYLRVPFILDKVNTADLEDSLDMNMILSILTNANTIWVSFDEAGTLSDASESDIAEVIAKLDQVCRVTPIKVNDKVHSYEISSLTNDESKKFTL